MILFWTWVAAMLLLGMLWIIPPLVRPAQRRVSAREQQNIEIARERLRGIDEELAEGALDQEQYDRARKEIEQILASDLGTGTVPSESMQAKASGVKSAFVVALLLPLLSILMYGLLGNPEGVSAVPGRTAVAGDPEHPASVGEMVSRLAERMQEEPNNPDGWRLLARSYSVMQLYPEAVEALRRARGLVGDDPDILIELADAVAAMQGGSFEGQPDELINKVLEQSPDNPGALWLAGRSALVARDFSKALQYWRKLESVLPADGEGAKSVHTAIVRVTEAMEKKDTGAEKLTNASEQTADTPMQERSAPEIRVKVALDRSLASVVSPNDAVFIYAQALSGPPMPLAVARKKVSDLPLQVALNDSMAMMPAMALSKFPEVRVIARVSKSGNAIPQSGDYKGQIEPVAVSGADPIEIVISEKIP